MFVRPIPRGAFRRAWRTLPPWLFALALSLCGTRAATAQVLTDDAGVVTAPKSLDANYGTNPNLSLSPSGLVFLKFDLASTLPAGTPGSAVQRATLRLFLANVTAPGAVDVYAVSDPWDELTITGRTAPPLGALVATTDHVSLADRGQFLTIDVTPLVRQWLGDDGAGGNGLVNQGLALAPQLGGPEVATITFDSKENAQTSHEAQLNIQFLTESASGITSIAANSPLSVSDPTTTPTISLGIVPASLGGTGLATPGTAGNLLRSNGSTWTSAPLLASDLPGGSGDYVQNGTTLQPASNFHISGTGKGDVFDAATQFNLGGSRMIGNAGSNNVFAGIGAGAVNAGGDNTFVGRNAGNANTTGASNTFVGNSAGSRNTTGGANAFFGSLSGFFNNTGVANAFFGAGAGNFNTAGFDNAFFGAAAGQSNTIGDRNAFFGRVAGFFNTTGAGNAFFGTDAGKNNTVGSANAFVGREAGFANVSGNNNAALGAFANVGAANLNFATAIGSGAVVTTSNSVVLGRAADTVRVPGTLSVTGALSANILEATTQVNLSGARMLANAGVNNVFVGVGTGDVNAGSENTFVGRNAGNANTTGAHNTFLGNTSGSRNTTGNFNTFVGSFSGFFNDTGVANAFFGVSAGNFNTSGFDNAFFGAGAGQSNTTGDRNAFFGRAAGFANDTGGGNAAFGTDAGKNTTTGSANAFVGREAGFANIEGSNNAALGAFAGVGASNLTFATAIGSGAVVSSSNTVVLGRQADTVRVAGSLGVAGGVTLGAAGAGVVLKSPDGTTCGLLTLTNAGTLSVAVVACP
jgi:hypothetical protein